MKVNPESGRCDFCGFYKASHTINGGLWWLCTPCMDSVYSDCTCTDAAIVIHHGICKFDGEEE